MKTEKPLFSGGPYDESMWNKYRVTLNFVGRVCGSTPLADQKLIEGWLNARKPSVRPPGGKDIVAIAEQVINTIPDMGKENEEIKNRTTISFRVHEGKLVVPAFTLRAHLKDCTSQVQNQLVGRIKGERNFTTRVKNGLYVAGNTKNDYGEDVVWITRDGKKLAPAEIDGYQERMIHASTPQGPISALKLFAYVKLAEVSFVVNLLGDSVKPTDLNTILAYGATHGYGGERSMGEGKYTYTIEKGE